MNGSSDGLGDCFLLHRDIVYTDRVLFNYGIKDKDVDTIASLSC
jgi:hypothetical protein